MKTYFSRLHYTKNPNIGEGLALTILLPAVFFYWLAVCARNFLYDKKLLKSKKLPAFVISVGNLTTGGTGKTPVTAKIASFITEELKKKTAVISRGYGGKLSAKNVNVISDGEKIFYNSELAGDEPFWIAENARGTAVVTGSSRFNSGEYAIKNFNTEVLILDDGFQHRKLARNLDILLIDCDKVFGNNFLLPAGPLRESLSRIKMANKVIIVNKIPYNTASAGKVRYLQEMLINKYQKKSCICEFLAEEIYEISSGIPVKDINKVIAFSGIAQPESFWGFLEDMGFNLILKKVFPDHYLYKTEDMKAIIEEALNIGAEAIITTEKDAVKIKSFVENMGTKIPVCALKLKLNLDMKKLGIADGCWK